MMSLHNAQCKPEFVVSGFVSNITTIVFLRLLNLSPAVQMMVIHVLYMEYDFSAF